MRRWWARSTTATSVLACVLLLGGGLTAAWAGAASERLLDSIEDLGAMPASQSRDLLRARCADDALCIARRLAEQPAERFRLRRRIHPDSDTIRWAKTQASLVEARRQADKRLYLRLDRFGRKAEAELRAAFAAHGAQGQDIVLDLSRNRGGDFERMLRVAAGFAGPVENALRLFGAQGQRSLSLPTVAALGEVCGLTVKVGPDTASSGEMLAALLARHAGARLVGKPTAGKDYLLRVLPVDHDWQLLVPAERVVVPGVVLAGGLVPAAAGAPSRGCGR